MVPPPTQGQIVLFASISTAICKGGHSIANLFTHNLFASHNRRFPASVHLAFIYWRGVDVVTAADDAIARTTLPLYAFYDIDFECAVGSFGFEDIDVC